MAGFAAFTATFAERFFVVDVWAGFLAPAFLTATFLPERFAAAFFATFLAVFLTAFFAVFLTAFFAVFLAAALRPFFFGETVARRGAALRAALLAFLFFFAAVFLALAITLP
ncbi:hypothetical protein [Afipia birgiae]|uniref:hypothetical protein n=1 Tax=Afipia birgiae TaxID=151414 RepID=UPI001FCC4400|nr:hypothetical protein [Afipia birgiae]